MVLGERYVIHKPLGRGGMGHVYQAHDRILEDDVAIKVIRGDFSRDTELARRFRSEIRLARRISHRNVCRIHEYGEDAGVRYLCMEFVDGVDLKRLLRDDALSAGDAFAVGIQAAEGLEAVHALGIIHRDLKPSNIMIDHRGVVRLMDFGIAKEIESEAGLTGSGHLLGTPEYMSPEQAQGLAVGYSSDVYALGCVIYECFAGRPPFRADTPVNTLYMHVHEIPSFGGATAASIPASVTPQKIVPPPRSSRRLYDRRARRILRRRTTSRRWRPPSLLRWHRVRARLRLDQGIDAANPSRRALTRSSRPFSAVHPPLTARGRPRP
jgi:serine/threonine protein kinase